jgi:hypothetical protein
MNDAWTRNEAMVRELDQKEGHYEGHENAPKVKRGPQQVEMVEDGALGLDGREFHMGGQRVTNLKEERLPSGDFNVYWQSENGGTYIQRWNKVAQGRHQPGERPRRIHGF